VVAVSHDAVNRQVLAALCPDLGDPDSIPQDNGCFNTLEWRDGIWTVLTVNEIPPPSDETAAGLSSELFDDLGAEGRKVIGSAGDSEVADLFRKAQADSRKGAEMGKQLLRSRLAS
jgi:hypothetical protein